MHRWSDLEELRGAAVRDHDGALLGTVAEVFADQLTDRGEWAQVRLAEEVRFVPLLEAEYADQVLSVPYDAAVVASAPDVGAAGHLNVDDEAQLYVHFGIDTWEQGSVSGGRTGGTPTGVPLPPHPPTDTAG